jgi:hypothetical protein
MKDLKLAESNVITKVHMRERGKQEDQRQTKNGRCYSNGFKNGRRDLSHRTVEGSRSWKGKNRFSQSQQKGQSPGDALILASEIHIGLQTSRDTVSG